MEEKDIHKLSNSYPEDLRYSDDKWEMALDGILAHEKKVRNRRIIGFVVGLGILALSLILYSILNSSTNTEGKKIAAKKDISIQRLMKKNHGNSARKKDSITKDSLVQNNNNPSNNADFTPVNNKTNKNNSAKKNKIKNKLSSKNTNSSTQKHAGNVKTSVSNKDYNQEIGKTKKTKSLDISAKEVGNNKSITDDKKNGDPITTNNEIKSSTSISHTTQLKNDISANYKNEKSFISPIKRRPIKISNFENRCKNNIQEIHYVITQNNPSKKQFIVPFDAISLVLSSSPWVDYGKNTYFKGIQPSMGLQYERNGLNKFSWKVGINYAVISDLPITLERATISYGYGVRREITSIKTDQLHLLSLPVQVSFRIHKRMQFTGGVGMSYLLTANNTLVKTKENYQASQLVSTEQAHGYIQGFKRTTFYTLLGANYWFTEKNSLGFNYQFGMSDISIDDEIRETIDDKNSKFEIVFKRIIR